MTEFHPSENNCLAKVNGTMKALKSVYFHAIFDFKRPSAIPLFTMQICRILLLCISKENFRIVLHYDDTNEFDYYRAALFLDSLSIPYISWVGTFDTVSSQRARMISLINVTSPKQYILQVDEDEIPSIRLNSGLIRMIHQMSKDTIEDSQIIDHQSKVKRVKRSKSCDAIFGYLHDRLPLDGSLVNITLSTQEQSLRQQFPLDCNVKGTVEKARNTKLIFYRASYRPSVGNHQLVCIHMNVSACNAMIRKSPNHRNLHPVVRKPPRNCQSIPMVWVDHYKYTWGLQEYLMERVEVFRELGLKWYDESAFMLEHLQNHQGKICINCEELKCKYLWQK